ncbi:MAG: cytochrome B subunit [Luteitalea sp.]|nr:cytochrome B subunit [Luteitalea sp.]
MPMRPMKFLSSSVGTKVLIAVTGLAFFLFLILHLAGNLLIFVGPEAFNSYSHKLVSNPLLLVAEAGLAAIFLLHVVKAVVNFTANRHARPVGYAMKRWARHTSRKSLASTTMIVSGTIIFGFLILHLITFKFGTYYEDPTHHYRDLHRLVLEKFSHPGLVGFYVLCMTIIGLHLRHGLASAFQSLGIEHPQYNRLIRLGGVVLALLIAAGFAAIPIWVYFVGTR